MLKARASSCIAECFCIYLHRLGMTQTGRLATLPLLESGQYLS